MHFKNEILEQLKRTNTNYFGNLLKLKKLVTYMSN